MRRLALSGIVAAQIISVACGGDSETRPQPIVMPPAYITGDAGASNPTPPRPEPLELAGVDKALLDPSTHPCDDFYQYACGGWIKSTEIPGDEASWYRSFSVIRDRNEDILHGILESLAKGEMSGEPYAKQLGEFYGTCMDEAAIEKQGTKPLEPWLKRIDAITDTASLARTIGKFQADGEGIVMDLSAAQDFNDASQVVGMIWQAGLGMPEREYYIDNSPKMTELRGKYEAHVTAMLGLAGAPEAKAKADAKKVLEIETKLATAWMTKEDRREPKKINHRTSRADLGKLVPEFPWEPWLDGAGAKGAAAFNVAQPGYVKALGEMLGKIPVADWKTYLRWHIFRGTADQLPQKFVDEKLKWRSALVGVAKLPPRWKRCVRTVDAAMGEALAQPFVKKTLGAEGKAAVVAMVQQIEASMHEDLEKVVWMDEATRKAAFGKLGKVANKIAYPDKWRSYEGIGITKDSYVANAYRASAFEYKRQLAKVGKPVDRAEWQMSPPTVNAYYDAQLNEMVFPAGILQPPFYANQAPLPMNFGGVGMVMGHELTHGFDDEGRQFDAEGNLRDWWSEKVNAEFERRAECVKKQFDDYTVLGDLHVNGKLTLGENIADLGGVKLSYRSMKTKSVGDPSADQLFFVGFAQSWCGKLRDEALRHQVSTNPHSPANYRVNGPLSNTPEFAAAFGCLPNSKMVRKDRCEVW